eukprot:TRINITY_DN9202_c0_g1_i1.p1 TRINITY_DN9202_c0_g1~~TRINITY_DN9202_c0_g1_i1.p1  ORF type:complete len:223 (-),score=18.54 TRINITY_DN9202_c0_g1_i1:310-918(-)
MATALGVCAPIACAEGGFSVSARSAGQNAARVCVNASPLQVSCRVEAYDGLRRCSGFAQRRVSSVSVPLAGESPVQKCTPRPAFSIVATVAAPTAPEIIVPKQKIRIRLRSYWVPLLEQSVQQVLEAAKTTGAKIMGPVPLPTKKRIYCVLRSPHVNKDSREHFEIRTHRRLIDLENPTAQTIDSLMQLSLPAGVDVEVKLS